MSDATITICVDEPIGRISPLLHGQFAEHLGACVDEGLWVGPESAVPNLGGLRSDVLEALRKLNVPVLRWPGGCFADDYHWEDGIGPRKERPRRVNLWWGQNVESNGFGTHEFITLCRYLGAEPYLAGNLGSGSVREMRDWVEYCNYPGDSTLARRRAANGSPRALGVKYWGVGNESWGCGGNLDPEEYATLYRRYATYLRDLGEGEQRTELFLIACGPDGNRAEWTRRFFGKLLSTAPFSNYSHTRIHGFAAHYYCGTAGASATEYTVDQWYELLEKASRMEELIVTQRRVLDEFDPQRAVGLVVDEWGTWHPPTPGRHPSHLWQQNTLRDALVAAITLDTFHRHADKVVMANIAQMLNVLQAMVLTEGDRMVTTPTYHVFELYQRHQGGTAVRMEVEGREIAFAVGAERRGLVGLSGSASVKEGELIVSVVNAHASLPVEAEIVVRGGKAGGELEVGVIADEDLMAHNTVEEPQRVRATVGREVVGSGEWRHTFVPASVTILRMRLGT
jgi:alpha-N-arabinofuranosidase